MWGTLKLFSPYPRCIPLVQFRRLRTTKDNYRHRYSYISNSYLITGDTEGRRQTRLDRVLEARVGIEPAYTALQAAA